MTIILCEEKNRPVYAVTTYDTCNGILPSLSLPSTAPDISLKRLFGHNFALLSPRIRSLLRYQDLAYSINFHKLHCTFMYAAISGWAYKKVIKVFHNAFGLLFHYITTIILLRSSSPFNLLRTLSVHCITIKRVGVLKQNL